METKPTIETVLERITEQTAMIQSLKEEVTGIKSEVAGIKSEVAGIKSEVAGIKGEVADIKQEVANLKALLEVVDARTRRIENRVNVLSQDVLDMRASVQRMDVELLSLKVAS